MTEDLKAKYAAKWLCWTTIPCGAGWCFAVGIIETGGRQRLRIAKGKMKTVANGEFPITQQNKLNLKPDDWPMLKATIEEYLERLEGR